MSVREDGTGGEGLRLSVLGPVQAWRGEVEVPLGSPQQRAVLAALVLRRGRPATVDELVDAVWGEELPGAPVSILRTYVSRLRGLLEPDRERGRRPEVLVSTAGGYAIEVPESAVDLAVFVRRVAEARGLREQGLIGPARERLRVALGGWAGVPLAGIGGRFADAERTRLAELRLSAIESRLELDLECGDHSDAVPELLTLTAAHPLRERLRLLLMRALYRADQQAEALAVYHDTRRLLVEQLGVEPGPAMQELYAQLLAADPQLSAPARAEPRSEVRTPAQLPADLADFTGREVETTALTTALRDGPAAPVALVSGMSGAGKTTLAVHVAHQVVDQFPDGQLYVDLRGGDTAPTDTAAALAGFLRALGERDADIPGTLVERAALYRSILGRRRILVLLDNAYDTQQIRPLLPGSGRSAALVTSISKLAALPVSDRVALAGFAPEAALTLFARIVGPRRVEAERDAVLRVFELCGGLPLALRIVASRLAARPDWRVGDVVEQLEDERHRLSQLRIDDLAVESCFRLGCSRLGDEQARAFRLLALPAWNSFEAAEAAVVLDRSPEQAAALLESLVDAGMLESPRVHRYRYHDLLRLFAGKVAQEQEEFSISRAAALTRIPELAQSTDGRGGWSA
jgi:DNA-binding SARP family transcriptional activator